MDWVDELEDSIEDEYYSFLDDFDEDDPDELEDYDDELLDILDEI